MFLLLHKTLWIFFLLKKWLLKRYLPGPCELHKPVPTGTFWHQWANMNEQVGWKDAKQLMWELDSTKGVRACVCLSGHVCTIATACQ